MPSIAETLEAAIEHHRSGELAEAERLYREVLQVDPRQTVAWHNLGTIVQGRGDAAAAVECFGRAIELNGGEPTFHNNLGTALQAQSRFAEAVACYQRALALAPGYAEAHCNLGSALKDQGQLDEAIECYQRALALDAEVAEAHFNLGVIHQGREELDKAADCYAQAIRARPSYAEAYNNLGSIHKRRDELEEATRCYSKALEFKPNFAEPLNNLGSIFHTQGRMTEAAVCYEQSLRINPRYPQAHYNRAILSLALGDFAAGWPEYEWRWHCPDTPKLRQTAPRWQGEPLAGRTLLVAAEQGLGDTLQFIRYLPLVEQKFGHAIVQVQKPLVPLLSGSGMQRVVARDAPLPRHDLWIPLVSLPSVFETRLDTIPAEVPYLTAEAKLVEHWRGTLSGFEGFKVGIAWQGSPTYRGDRFRSIPLAQFEPLAHEGVELFSLQKGPGCEQLAAVAGRFAVRDFGPSLDEAHGPFMDTAAILRHLDLVITSDSAVAHLAGALGVATWVALPFAPDWRWLTDRDDSPWYPTMRLFRQRQFGDWNEVFQRIAAALRDALGNRG